MIGVKTAKLVHGVLLAALLGPTAACRSRPAAAGPAGAPAPEARATPTEEATVPAFQKPSDEELRKRLEPLAYEVTQHEGTEPPYQNAYWDEHRPGLYVDVVSGEPLFSSLDKFDSRTGWPSFTRPLSADAVTTRVDHKMIMARTEVRSKLAGSHLGHVFDDGPAPTGLRYCMNSAALRFVPVERLAAEGYGRFLPLFEQADARAAQGTRP